MPKTVLICIKDHEMGLEIAKLIEDEVTERTGEKIFTKLRESRDETETTILNEDIDLVITEFHHTSADTKEDVEKGASLLFSADRNGCRVPFILLSHVKLPKLYEVTPNHFQYQVVEYEKGDVFKAELKKHCCDLMGTLLPEPQPQAGISEKKGLVEITMDIDSEFWGYRIVGKNDKKSWEDQGIITIKTKTLTQLLKDSCKVETKICSKDNQDWVKALEKIGETMFDEVFTNNPEFSRDFYRLDGIMEERRHIRFCFKFKKSIHSVHLEAIFDKEEKQWPHYLVLISPVYRTLCLSCVPYQEVFDRQDRKRKINCLLIKSDVEAFYPGLNMRFKKLQYVSEEVKQIYDLMIANKDQFNIGKIKVLDLESDQDGSEDWKPVKKKDFVKRVRQTLEEETWHIVHYAGHSEYFEDRGYIIFPRTEREDLPVGFGVFSSWLRTAQTQLLFMSSCRSSAANIVFELARNRIPAILGFRWNLSDRMALKYATIFYHHLVAEGRPLEKAFQHTTRHMYDLNKSDPIWASPLLVRQGV